MFPLLCWHINSPLGTCPSVWQQYFSNLSRVTSADFEFTHTYSPCGEISEKPPARYLLHLPFKCQYPATAIVPPAGENK